MSKLNWGSVKGFAATVLAAGKKNAPTLMTAGSVVLGWTAVYIFWKQGRKAEKKIEAEQAKRDSDDLLPKREKFTIYLQYCWLAGLLGLASTGLSIGANAINLSRLAELALLTQFMDQRGEKQQKLINALKEKLGVKEAAEVEMDQIREEHPPEKSAELAHEMAECGDFRTHFIDTTTGVEFDANIIDVCDAIARINEDLRDRRSSAVTEAGGTMVSDLPWGLNEDAFSNVYASTDLSDFLDAIGESEWCEKLHIGELLEFRYYGGTDLIKTKDVLKFDPVIGSYFDPEGQHPEVCYLDYAELLSPSNELVERNIL